MFPTEDQLAGLGTMLGVYKDQHKGPTMRVKVRGARRALDDVSCQDKPIRGSRGLILLVSPPQSKPSPDTLFMPPLLQRQKLKALMCSQMGKKEKHFHLPPQRGVCVSLSLSHMYISNECT